jgi:anti-sigma factor RsiW
MDDVACTDVVEVMTDYLEGALPAAEARRVEGHLETCPGCTEYLAQMRTIAGSLGALADESIPVEMRDRLIAAFRDVRRTEP